jgi:hypothetical protein
MSKIYTREALLAMKEEDLSYVYQTVTNQTLPTKPKRIQLIDEILETQLTSNSQTKKTPSSPLSSPSKGRKTSKSPEPKTSVMSTEETIYSPPVKTVRSTMIKVPKKASSSPVKQVVTVNADVVSRGLIQKDIFEDKEKGEDISPSEAPVKRGRGRPPKSKKSDEESSSRSKSETSVSVPKSPTSERKSMIENIATQVKQTKVLNPKASFQTAAIKERSQLITPIVVSDVNVSTVALPVSEEAKISISDFLSGIGFTSTIPQAPVKPSPRASRGLSPIRKDAEKGEPEIKVTKTTLIEPSEEPSKSVKIISKTISKVLPPSEEIVSEEEEEEKEQEKEVEAEVAEVIKPIKISPISIPKKIVEVEEEPKEEKKPRRRATVVKRTTEALVIPGAKQIPERTIEIASIPYPSPKSSPVRSIKTPSPKLSPVPSPKLSPVPSPKLSSVPSPKLSPVPSPKPSPVPSPKPSPKLPKKSILIPDISDVPSVRKSAKKKKISTGTIEKIDKELEEEIDWEDFDLVRKPTKKTVPVPDATKKTIKKTVVPPTRITEESSDEYADVPSPSPSPVLVRRLTTTTEVKEKSKGPKEVIKNIESDVEEVEEPVSESQAEKIFTRIQSGTTSKSSSKAPSRAPSAPPSARKTTETVDYRGILEKIDRNKVNETRKKTDYSGKDLENFLKELRIPYTGLKKSVLVKKILDKMDEYGL